MANKIVYIGNKPEVVKMLSVIKEIEVVAIIYEKDKVNNEDLRFYCGSIRTIMVIDKSDMESAIQSLDTKVDFAIMYSFGIIIPFSVIQKTEIFNFHPGDLRYNRGPVPINWSVLKNESTTKMSLHRIDDKVDCGELVCERECIVRQTDVPSTLRNRMEGEIPSMVLELLKYKKDNKKNKNRIQSGVYRNRITEEDYTILETDSEVVIRAKIRSQYDYKGAILTVNEIKHYIRSWEEYIDVKRKLAYGLRND